MKRLPFLRPFGFSLAAWAGACFLIGSLLGVGAGCSPVQPKYLTQTWYVAEEFTPEGQRVYHPLPEGTARSGRGAHLTFLPGGTLLAEQPGANDRIQTDTGTWRIVPQDVLEISLPDQKTYQLPLVRLRKTVLIVKLP